MANKRMDELTAKTSVVDADLLLLYDSEEAGAEKTKKITLDNFVKSGTWTPVIADASSGGNTGTAGTLLGRYVQIGKLIVASLYALDIDTTGMTASNRLHIRGLPATAQSTTALEYSVTAFGANIAYTDTLQALIVNGTDYIIFSENRAGNQTALPMNVDDFTSGSADVILTIIYEAA